MSKKKEKNKSLIIVGIIVGAIVAFLIVSAFIVVDECASPCRFEKKKTETTIDDPLAGDGMACPAVCVRETLLMRMLEPLLY